MLKVYVFSSWQINQDYIAQTSCENRNNAASDCEGKCQLIKQLKETEPSEKPFTPPAGVEKVELSTFTTTEDANPLAKTEDSSIIHFNHNDKLMPSGISNSLFQPPEPLV